ncbi:MAG TPA: M67 family metallopeptidase [Thermomicrobiales bacterium]|nr:M67 family metallopeptidase [Thermomicrobiales bacterium]
MNDTQTHTRASPIALPDDLAAAIARHGEATSPDECCGILLGTDTGGQRLVDRLLPIDNQWDEGERRRRFLIQPADLLRAEREARLTGLDVLGFYHSHPDAPARPSEFDREHAWPWYTYLIASIEQGAYAAMTGWQLKDDRTGYEEVVVTCNA